MSKQYTVYTPNQTLQTVHFERCLEVAQGLTAQAHDFFVVEPEGQPQSVQFLQAIDFGSHEAEYRDQSCFEELIIEVSLHHGSGRKLLRHVGYDRELLEQILFHLEEDIPLAWEGFEDVTANLQNSGLVADKGFVGHFAQVVEIEDPSLRRNIQMRLGMDAGWNLPVPYAFVRKMRTLILEGTGQEIDITLLSLMTNLYSLKLTHATVASFAPLKQLEKLFRVDLSHTNLPSISYLCQCQRLNALNVHACSALHDFSDLGKLKPSLYGLWSDSLSDEMREKLRRSTNGIHVRKLKGRSNSGWNEVIRPTRVSYEVFSELYPSTKTPSDKED